MPLKRHPDTGVVTIVSAEGLLSFVELVEFIHDEGVSASSPVLFDAALASAEHLSSADIQQLAAFALRVNRASHRVDVAIVAANDDEFGMARMFQELVTRDGCDNVGVFRRALEATAWLLRRHSHP